MIFDIIFNIIFLAIGLIFLIKGSDMFVDSGSSIARILKINEILFGLTFVSISTSLPELLISINASLAGAHSIAIGNIVGSNIFNMCAILGIICIIKPVKFLRETVKKDIYMGLVAAIILLIVLLDVFGTNLTENVISRTDGIIMLIFFIIFMYYSLYNITEDIHANKLKKQAALLNKSKEEIEEEKIKAKKIRRKDILIITKRSFLMIVGLALIFIGADFTVDSAKYLATALHFSEEFIAILVIAIGTSLPEISTSIAAIKKGKSGIAIGNLIGSNIFNILFVLSISSFIQPIILLQPDLLIDIGLFIVIMLIIALCTSMKFELNRKEGFLLLSIYIGYLIYVISRM